MLFYPYPQHHWVTSFLKRTPTSLMLGIGNESFVTWWCILQTPLNTTHRKIEMSDNTFVDRLQPFRGKSGIYFLVKNDDVVYIGESSNLYVRILEHRSGLLEEPIVKDFDHVRPVIIDDNAIRPFVEMFLICELQPTLNIIKFDNFTHWYNSIPDFMGKSKFEKIQELSESILANYYLLDEK